MNKLEEEKKNNATEEDARKWIHYRSRLRTYTNKYIRIHQNKKG